MIQSLLIANRGEIAVRIARSARALGLRTVAVFTEHDRDGLHPKMCDHAVLIPDYLDAGAIIAAAQATGAQAIHPGFGFLSENAEFAQAVTEGGLVWVGPPPSAIEAMGSKAAARALMADAGVPVLPGYDGEAQDEATLAKEAKRIGWPVIVKASAGGGGKGMQVVESAKDFGPAVAEARRLAAASFGDDRLILERYLATARHIEVQVMADTHGNCLHLWERECSIQRRHQKVIEEAPSPAFSGEGGEELRLALCGHAVQAAQAVDYEGAGTVEFVVDDAGQAYFLEMNTRLQVEHPVTEAITGLDLVELQLRVASGDALPLSQEDVGRCGWAVEARLYAEDPDNGYLPSTGTLAGWHVPEDEGLRVDAGVEQGSHVGIHYDPMLAKVIAYGDCREVAVQRLERGLSRLVALGLVTNRSHLMRILRHPTFREGALSTRFLEIHADDLGPGDTAPRHRDALTVAAVLDWLNESKRCLPGLTSNWRNNRWRDPSRIYRIGEEDHTVSWHDHGGTLTVDGRMVRIHDAGVPMRLEIDGVLSSYCVVDLGEVVWVRTDDGDVPVGRVPDFVVPGSEVDAGGCAAPMPGKIVQVLVSEGQTVSKGDPLVVLEAMKMEQTLRAPADGTITSVNVVDGEQVDGGAVLVVLEE